MTAEGNMASTSGAADGVTCDTIHQENQSEDNRKSDGGSETKEDNPNDGGEEKCRVQNWSPESDAAVDTKIMLSTRNTGGDIGSAAAHGVACDRVDVDHGSEDNCKDGGDSETNEENVDDGWDEIHSAVDWSPETDAAGETDGAGGCPAGVQ